MNSSPSSRQPRVENSLSFNILLTTVLISLAVTLFISIGISLFVNQTERTAWHTRQVQAVRYAAHTVESFIFQVQDALKLVGYIHPDYLRVNPEFLTTFLSRNPALLEVVLIDRDGDVYASVHQARNPVLANRFTIPLSNWYLQAVRGATYLGEVEISADQEPYLILAMPTRYGVVAGRLRMTMLWELVADLRSGQTDQAYIADRHGHIIAHPDQSIPLGRPQISQRAELQSAMAAPQNKWTGEYTNFSQAPVVGSTASILGGEWLVFAEVTQAEAFAASRRALLTLGGIALVGGLLLILATIYAFRRLVLHPLRTLRDGTVIIGQGDLNYRLRSPRQDEIGQVAAAFDEMAGSLQERETALAQARDQALDASRFKSRLLANVSHDLRTPLTAIMGYADILKEEIYGPLNPRQRDIIQRILSNTRRLVTMINSMLDQAQIEAGKLELLRVPFAPDTLICEVEAAAGYLAQKQGPELRTAITPDLPQTLIGDPQRLQLIIGNLTENAIKFTERGWVSVRLYRQDDAHWVIEVADTGRGIPPEAQSYIFEPFKQVDGSTTRQKGGVGLGLSIVHQLVGLMGGAIDLVSLPGQGSKFTIQLPLETTEETQ